MDAAELKSYEQQLAQVQGALRSDPDNAELRTLEGELQNLIDLTKQLLGAQTSASAASSAPAAASSSSSKPAHTSTSSEPAGASDVRSYAVGDECQAKYEADGRWYAARVVAITGSAQNPMYTVMYRGYDQTEIVTAAALRPSNKPGGGAGTSSHAPHAGAGVSSNNGKANAARTAEEEAERERKKRRSEKKAGRFATRTAEVEAVQNSWQKFAKKAEKKGVTKRAGGGGSMFKTPDDPLAKVGVVGAGRGMTQYGDRKKHGYDRDAAPLG